jgi:Flp pilus assembly pilin Flp
LDTSEFNQRGAITDENMEGVSFFGDRAMLRKLLMDDSGGEVLEYALIAGLIIVAAIGLVAAVGNKVVARWTSVNSSL